MFIQSLLDIILCLLIKFIKPTAHMLFNGRSNIFIYQLDLLNDKLLILLDLLCVLIDKSSQGLPYFSQLYLQLDLDIFLQVQAQVIP